MHVALEKRKGVCPHLCGVCAQLEAHWQAAGGGAALHGDLQELIVDVGDHVQARYVLVVDLQVDACLTPQCLEMKASHC